MKTRLHALAAYARLLRPPNVLMIAAGTVVGGVLVAGTAALGETRLLLAALSAACLGAAGNSYNDAADVEIDRINRPLRPLPAGAASVRGARALWAGLTAVGVVLGFGLSAVHGLIALGAAGLLVLYSRLLKQRPLVGNVAVALLIGVALVYGGLAVGPAGAALVGAGFAFLTTLAREIAKDVEDEDGDAALGARTLPLAWGRGRAVMLAQGTVGLTLALLPLPYFAFGFAPLYLLVALGAAAALAASLLRLHPRTPQQAGQASRDLKWAMLVGMAALAVG